MADATSTATALGPRFCASARGKDFEALRAVLHPDAPAWAPYVGVGVWDGR
jgi:hypothetical protein